MISNYVLWMFFLAYNINFTYERDDGLVHSWPDHILTFNYCAGDISIVKCIHSPDNFSDHVPISFNLCCNLQPISNTDIVSSYPNINGQSNFDWIKIDSMLIEAYQSYVEASLPIIPPDLLNCSTIGCKLHQQDIDIVCDHLFSCLCAAGQHCFPRYSKRSKVHPGWNDSVRILRSKALLWNRIWSECGCPINGVLSQIRKKAKSRYKYAVRSAKRRKDSIISKKITSALSTKQNRLFWQEVKRLKRSKATKRSRSPIVDGFTDSSDVTDNFRSKLSRILNSVDEDVASLSFLQEVNYPVNLSIDTNTVSESLARLKTGKNDCTQLSSYHLLLASPVIDSFLAKFFTVIIRHSFMPKLLRNCTLMPIPKPGKDPSQSDNYRAIALAPNLSKVLEWSILLQYGSYLSTSELQFGFKSGVSSDTCTGLLKNTIAFHLQGNTKVYGCFLDASKAFDRVNHNTLFASLSLGACHLLYYVFFGLGIRTNPVLLSGILVYRPLLALAMVCVRVGYCLLFYSQFTLMNYYSVCLTLILDVTLVTIMLDPYVMLMK